MTDATQAAEAALARECDRYAAHLTSRNAMLDAADLFARCAIALRSAPEPPEEQTWILDVKPHHDRMRIDGRIVMIERVYEALGIERQECRHTMLADYSSLHVIDPYKAKCTVCLNFFDLPLTKDGGA